MKVLVHTPQGDAMDFDLEVDDTVGTLKLLIYSVKQELEGVDGVELSLKGEVLANDDATIADVRYQEGDVMMFGLPIPAAGAETCTITAVGAKGQGKGRGLPLQGRPGTIPTSGFAAVEILVSSCGNEKTNGLYTPEVPYNGKPVWYKAPSPEEPSADDSEDKSADRGERCIYYSARAERWYVGDALEEGGFTFAAAFGQSTIPPLSGWRDGTLLECQSAASGGDLDAPAALRELTKLLNVEPWADQEVCYTTMLKVLGNIVAHPGEAKFHSLKVENAAIQNKILRHDGARGFLEATGFRESDGVLTLPHDRGSQAQLSCDFLQGFANEAAYANIRKERWAKAAEEAKKDAARPKRYAGAGKDEDAGPRFGRDRGMRGGG